MQVTGYAAGAVVGEHRIVRRLGAGGMGAVDLAEHIATGAQRALKSIDAQSHPELLVRFRREAEALARLGGHPNVVRIHTVGVAHGRLYLVMELHGGGDLEERLQAGPWAPPEVAKLGVALARGLSHAHAHGIIHRDLKPSNVLFAEDGRPVLVDFGLAQSGDFHSLTRSGQLLGTPLYMAPEQTDGRSQLIGPPTDVYGLAAVLYRALTGRPPAVGENLIEVLNKVLHVDPPAPSSLVPGVPRALDEALLRALAKEPGARFPSTLAFMRALVAVERDAGRRAGRGWLVAGVATLGVGGVALVVATGGRGAVEVAAVRSAGPAAVRTAPTPAPLPPRTEPPPDPRSALPATLEAIPAPGPWPGVDPGLAAMGELLVAYSFTRLPAAAGGPAPADDPRYVHGARLLADLVRSERAGAKEAWYELSLLFEEERGLRRSPDQVLRCLEEAARRGHAAACAQLGRRLADGWEGRPANVPAGRRWLEQALTLQAEDSDGNMARNRAYVRLVAMSRTDPPGIAPAEVERYSETLGETNAHDRTARADLRFALRRDADALVDLWAIIEDPGYGGGALSKLIFHLAGRGPGPELARARAELERLAPLQPGHAVALADLLVREADEAREAGATLPGPARLQAQRSAHLAESRAAELLERAAEAEEAVLWHTGETRKGLYRLRLRQARRPAGSAPPQAQAALARARELLDREANGAEIAKLVEAEVDAAARSGRR